MSLNKRIQQIQPSQTLAVAAKAKKLQREGVPIIDFSAGEPDFDTPQHIKNAAIQAINAGFSKYTETPGIPELRQAIVTKMKRDYGLEFRTEETIASNGGKQAIFNALSVLLDPDDEVLIPTPYWTSYPEMVSLVGGIPRLIYTTLKQDFKITPEQLKHSITDRTKILIFNSPSNPTGATYTADELKELAEVLRKNKNIYIVTDDIYEQLIYDSKKFTSILHVAPELRERTIIINGLSKAYAMTGWRIGYSVAPAYITLAMSKFQGQTTSNINSIAQKSAVEALTGDQTCVHEFRDKFQQRRDLMFSLLAKIPNIELYKPDGAFYLFPDFSRYLTTKYSTSVALADYLIDQAQVAVVPGSAFGAEGFLRLSYATSQENIKLGVDKMTKALANLGG